MPVIMENDFPTATPSQRYALIDWLARILWMLPHGPPSHAARGDIAFGALMIYCVASWEVFTWGLLIRQSLPPFPATVAMASVFLVTAVLERDIFMSQGAQGRLARSLQAGARVVVIIVAGLAAKEPLSHKWLDADIQRFAGRRASLGLVARGFLDLEKKEQKQVVISTGVDAKKGDVARALEAQGSGEARRKLAEAALDKLQPEADRADALARSLDSQARSAAMSADAHIRASAWGLRDRAQEQRDKWKELQLHIEKQTTERRAALEQVEIAASKLAVAQGAERAKSGAEKVAEAHAEEVSLAVLDYLKLSVHDPAARLLLGGREYPAPRPVLTYTDRVEIMMALQRGEGPDWPTDTPADLRTAMEKKLRVTVARPSTDMAAAVRWQGFATHVLAMLIPGMVLLIKLFGGLSAAKAYYDAASNAAGRPKASPPSELRTSSGGGWIRPPAPNAPRSTGGGS